MSTANMEYQASKPPQMPHKEAFRLAFENQPLVQSIRRVLLGSESEEELSTQITGSREVVVGNDRLIFVCQTPVDQDKLNLAIQEFRRIWQLFRESQDSQIARIEVVQSPPDLAQRPGAIMKTDPKVFIDLGSPHFLDYVTHEATHAVIGAETGAPESKDFAEGCAMRLAAMLGPRVTDINLPRQDIIEILQQMQHTGELKRSFTEALEPLWQDRNKLYTLDIAGVL